MSQAAVDGLRRAVAATTSILVDLSEDDWSRPSGCSGWTVRDLVAHIGSNYKETVDPSPPPPEPILLPAERMMDLLVDARADWTHEQVLEEYLQYAPAAIEVLASMQEEPLASTRIPLADLGEYPMHQLADAFAFDGYCHLRVDLLGPLGPFTRDLDPPTAADLGPTIGWMLAGLPQMQPGLVNHLRAPIRLEITGPGGGSWFLDPRGDEIHVVEDGEAATTVTTDGHDFVIWGTCRRPWRELATVTGDRAVAETFLDELNII